MSAFKEKVLPLVRKLLPVIIVLVLLGAAFFIWSSLPKAATLVFSLKALDDSKTPSIFGVTLSDANGNSFDGSVEDSEVYFDESAGLVSGEYSISVDGGEIYASAVTPSSVTLEPGSNDGVLTIPFRYSLDVIPTNLSVSLPAGCSKLFSVTVYNKAQRSAETGLVAEGDLAPLFSSAEPSKTIATGASAQFLFNFTAPSSAASAKQAIEKKGVLRLKRTRKTISVVASVGAGPQLDLSSSDITFSQDDTKWIKISNKGKYPATELRVEVERQEGMTLEVRNVVKELAAGGETNFAVDVSASSPGKYLGKLRISDAGCNPQEITVTLNRK